MVDRSGHEGLHRASHVPLWRRGVRALRRRARRLGIIRRARQASFVYDPAYERSIWGVPLDPMRADRILAFLTSEGLVRRDEIEVPRPAAMKNILLAHTPEYVESLQRPGVLTGILGTPVGDEDREATIDLQRLMTGGTIHATRLAIASELAAVNLGGGFHHAEPGRGMGFCIFNDLVVAIRRLRARGFAPPILVIDLDLHDGNGTRAAFASDPTVHTFSIHNDHWGDTDAVESTSIALGAGVGDDAYLGALVKSLPPLLERFRPGLVLYLAGCDPAADDAIGNWRITAEGMLARDRFVAEQLRARRTPFAITLGGGYGDGAWRYSARFLAWLLAGTVIEPPDAIALTLLRFRQIKAQLDPASLTRGEGGGDGGWSLTEEDLVGILPGIPRQTRFLGYFSSVGIELMLERFGILQQLRARGFRSPQVRLELDHPLGQTLRIWGDPARSELLVELRVSRSQRAVPGMEVLAVEWLLLQNPRGSFSEDRPPLPGQQHPGLGLLAEVFGWLVVVAETLGLDGVYFHPNHFHVAELSRRHVRFLHPVDEARFQALRDALATLPFTHRSEAVERGAVSDPAGRETFGWQVHPMVLPVSERLQTRVTGPDYEDAVAAVRATLDLTLRERPLS
jgi:acetoin utilization deacetylase AcuC-like enzyme